MAGVDVGAAGGKRRASNSEVNMIPFIDLLMVTIAFLLITAVWVNRSRISADAQVPGRDGCGEDCPRTVDKVLHVHVREREFGLVWKQASTVVSETTVPRSGIAVGEGGQAGTRYPELAAAISDEWRRQGSHTDPSDRRVDQAILHTDDRAAFREVVAVLDAIYEAKRDFKSGDGSVRKAPVFNMVFAMK